MKYRSSDLFGSVELDTSRSDFMWTCTVPSNEVERFRLEAVVVQAAKGWRESMIAAPRKFTAAEQRLWNALDALLVGGQE